MLKDYYHILGISPEAGAEEIKKVYRHLALKYHPDTNKGQAGAEEKFKLVSEAYGVLIDPQKRQQYDRQRADKNSTAASPGGFTFSQEEILRDLRQNFSAWEIFHEMRQEVGSFRFDEHFLGQIFGGGSRNFPGSFQRTKSSRPSRPSFAKTTPVRPRGFWGNLIGGLVRKLMAWLDQGFSPTPEWKSKSFQNHADIIRNLSLSREQAIQGTEVKLAINNSFPNRQVRVKIPPGTRHGSRLRLRGMGRGQGKMAGDLYLQINLTD